MDGGDVLRFKTLPVEMEPESGQQEHITEGVEMAYMGRHVVFWSVTEVSDDRVGAEEQVGRDAVNGGLTEALAVLAEVFVPGIDDRVHITRDGKWRTGC